MTNKTKKGGLRSQRSFLFSSYEEQIKEIIEKNQFLSNYGYPQETQNTVKESDVRAI